MNPAMGALFQGCSVTPLTAVSWKFRCGEVSGAVGDEGARPSLLEDAVKGLKQSWPGEMDLREQPLKLAGREGQGVRLALHDPKGERIQANATVARLGLAGGRQRLVLCVARTVPGADARCEALLEYLAGLPDGVPPPPGLAARRNSPDVLGHELSVPAGCEATPQGRDGVIQCGKVPALAWNVFDDPARLEPAAEEVAKRLRESGSVKVEEAPGVACEIEGVAARCHHFVLDAGPGGKGDMYVGGVEVRRYALLVMCLGMGGEVLPEACGQVLRLR